MSQARALTSDEVRGLREELTAGGTPMVWFTASAVGVPEGRSGKVVSLDEPAEGDFIQVRPAGSKDVLSFSAGEVTLVKPPRKRKEPQRATPSTAAKNKPVPAATAPAASEAVAKPSTPSAAKPSAPTAKPDAKPSASTAKTAAKQSTSKSPESSPAGGARRKPRQPSGATVTLTADQAGQWSAEVTAGKKRVLRPTPVAASAVAQAVKTLHDDVAEAVEPLLAAAREQQRARVEQLQQELADAQRMLDELTE